MLDGFAARCRELVQVYATPAGGVHALRGVTAVFPRASVTAVVGPSGSGKSTLLRLLACFERPIAGQVWLGEAPTAQLSSRRRRQLSSRQVGYVFQRPVDNLFEYLSAERQIELSWRLRQAPGAGELDSLIDAMGLRDQRHRRPAALDAGEQQRVAFAMGVAGKPTLIIADEPTAELPRAAAATLVETIRRLRDDSDQTFVVATHDPVLIDAADQVLTIQAGSLAGWASRGGATLLPIDDGGRVVLPPAARRLFTEGRARVDIEAGDIRLGRP